MSPSKSGAPGAERIPGSQAGNASTLVGVSCPLKSLLSRCCSVSSASTMHNSTRAGDANPVVVTPIAKATRTASRASRSASGHVCFHSMQGETTAIAGTDLITGRRRLPLVPCFVGAYDACDEVVSDDVRVAELHGGDATNSL